MGWAKNRVKYFFDEHDPDAALLAASLAEQMWKAGIDFSCRPGFGPITVLIDGRASYGPTKVARAIAALLAETERSRLDLARRTKQRGAGERRHWWMVQTWSNKFGWVGAIDRNLGYLVGTTRAWARFEKHLLSRGFPNKKFRVKKVVIA